MDDKLNQITTYTLNKETSKKIYAFFNPTRKAKIADKINYVESMLFQERKHLSVRRNSL